VSASRKPAATAAERRERYLAAQSRYNTSRKGKKRYKAYEDAHPERNGNRWEPARNAVHFGRMPDADGPSPSYEWIREMQDV
jgi:hypothetical protein